MESVCQMLNNRADGSKDRGARRQLLLSYKDIN